MPYVVIAAIFSGNKKGTEGGILSQPPHCEETVCHYKVPAPVLRSLPPRFSASMLCSHNFCISSQDRDDPQRDAQEANEPHAMIIALHIQQPQR